MDKEEIKRLAKEVGFDACGIATAEPFGEEMIWWKEWVDGGYNGLMEYMKRRINPSEMMEGTKSVIVCLLNYYSDAEDINSSCRIAKYAYSRDYHYIMWEKLNRLAERIGLREFKVACDTQPVMERALAVRAGLGWIGKNNMLITSEFGSYTFIGELFTTLPLEADEPITARCGRCRRCVESCPTGALSERCIDARRCLSYRTIESKEPLSEEEARHGWLFGCDECQDACPWNKSFARVNGHLELKPVTLGMEIETLTNSAVRHSQSPLSRANISKLKENYRLCISNRQNS